MKLEFLGQGTLSARLRAARGGIPAFYTPAGVGTVRGGGQRGPRSSMGVPTFSSTPSKATTRWSAPTGPTATGTWSTEAPLGP